MQLASPSSLTVGCLSEPLNCPAVTTQISISLTRTHAPLARSAALLCACLCLGSAFIWRERVRVRIDIREIWICGDIDQVECSQGEHLVWERGSGFGGEKKAEDHNWALSLHPRSRRLRLHLLCLPCLLWMIVNMSFSTCLTRFKRQIQQEGSSL